MEFSVGSPWISADFPQTMFIDKMQCVWHGKSTETHGRSMEKSTGNPQRNPQMNSRIIFIGGERVEGEGEVRRVEGRGARGSLVVTFVGCRGGGVGDRPGVGPGEEDTNHSQIHGPGGSWWG